MAWRLRADETRLYDADGGSGGAEHSQPRTRTAAGGWRISKAPGSIAGGRTHAPAADESAQKEKTYEEKPPVTMMMRIATQIQMQIQMQNQIQKRWQTQMEGACRSKPRTCHAAALFQARMRWGILILKRWQTQKSEGACRSKPRTSPRRSASQARVRWGL